VENGKVVSREISENIRKKFQWAGIRSPFLGESEGKMVCR